MKNDSRFCIFILSHKRAKNIHTLKTIKRLGYTGQWYVVVDDMDEQLDEYKIKIPSANLLVFNKSSIRYDSMLSSINKENTNASVFARNFICDFSKKQKYDYILMADDDISDLKWRIDNNGHIKECHVSNINKIFDLFIDFLKVHPSLAGISTGFYAGYYGGAKAVHKITREVFQFVLLKVSNMKPYQGFREEDTLLSYVNFENIYLSNWGLSVVTPMMGKGNGGVDYGNELSPPLFDFIVKPTAIKVTGFFQKIRYTKLLYPKIISDRFKK